jgi:thiol-disulfide isomerase/thioredoxin
VHAAPPTVPDWTSGLVWLQPARLDPTALTGRVTVVEFWTFACINCRRTIPAMRALASSVAPEVAIVGIHTPETDEERDAAAVRRAIAREHIGFAVAQDNDYRAWRAFGNQYWPALYLLDRQGRVRYSHIGELHLGTPQWKAVLGEIAALRAEPRPRG